MLLIGPIGIGDRMLSNDRVCPAAGFRYTGGSQPNDFICPNAHTGANTDCFTERNGFRSAYANAVHDARSFSRTYIRHFTGGDSGGPAFSHRPTGGIRFG